MVLKALELNVNILCFVLFVCGNVFVSSADSYRLANNTRPLSYEIELNVNSDCNAADFSGFVKINIQALETNNFITLHTGANITIGELKVLQAKTSAPLIITNVTYNETTEIRTLILQENLQALEKYFLEISYAGKLSDDKLGFYKSSYTNDAGLKVCLTSTQFAPTNARRAFPCYDEPSFKAEYEIRIIHSNGTSAMSNEKVCAKVERKDGTILTVFRKVPLMSTYLVGFAVTDYGFIEKDSTELAHRIYSRTNELEHVRFALDFGVAVYKYLAEYFDHPLPLEQLKHVAIPDFHFSAMENWGMITYKESRFLFNPELHPPNLMHSISNVIAHEVTHHWFGDLVTMKWWTHVWLKEGFATLFSYLGQEHVRPDYQPSQFLVAQTLQAVFAVDSDPEIKPMSKYIEKQADIMANYNKIAYDKACCVLRMFRNAFSDSLFRNALQKYLKSHLFGNTDEEDLFSAFQESMPDKDKYFSVATAMRSWTQQSGYPVVYVSLRNSTIHLQQEPFYHKNPKEKPIKKAIWWIPLTLAGSNVKVKQLWFNDSRTELKCLDYFESCDVDEFFLANHQQIGYYRVNYDNDHWWRIVKVLRENHLQIHVNNRAQLIDDALNLAFTNRLSYSIAFKLLEYLGQEADYAPWAAFKRGISYLKRLLSGDSNIDKLNKFVQIIMSSAYKNSDLSKNVTNYISKFSRQLIVNISCEYGLSACLQEKQDYSHPDLREIYYCNKLRAGDNIMYANLRNMLKTTVEPVLRTEIISSLGCSLDHNQLSNVLLMAVDKSNSYLLTNAERIQVIQGVYTKGQTGVIETLNFIENEDLKDAFTTKDFEKISSSLAKYINTYELYKKFNNIMENLLANEKLKDAKATIRENLYWIADYSNSIFNPLLYL